MALIKKFIHVVWFDNKENLQIYQFDGDDRLERALRFCQGLLDEHKAYFMKEFEE